MNRVTIRQPTRLCISDACPWGIAGYSLRGRSWRIVIPPCTPLRGDNRFNNIFEFIGTAVTTWFECLDADKDAEECILALGDNTSALGWIYRSSRVKPTSMSYKAIQMVARHLASVFLDSTHCLASQHLKGDIFLSSPTSCLLPATTAKKRTRWLRTTRPTTYSPKDSTNSRTHRYRRTSPSPLFRKRFYPGRVKCCKPPNPL
jgi:hypothetical protein